MCLICVCIHVFSQIIDCGYTLEPPQRGCSGRSNEYPQSMFWIKNKKIRYTPAYPNFAILKWGIRGCTLYGPDGKSWKLDT